MVYGNFDKRKHAIPQDSVQRYSIPVVVNSGGFLFASGQFSHGDSFGLDQQTDFGLEYGRTTSSMASLLAPSLISKNRVMMSLPFIWSIMT